MNDLVTRLRLDGSDHNKELDKAKGKVKEYKDEADDASKSLNDLGKNGGRSAKELLAQMSKMENGIRSTSNYRAQLSQITKQIQDLTINYRAMNKEMQDSDFGREVALKIQELTQKASEYKDAILDAQASISAMASDTANWDTIKGGIELISSSMEVFVSTGVLGEKTTEQLVSVLAKLKAIETATNAVIKIGNALQKQSALMLGVSRIQTSALAKAKTLEAVATGKATIAQKLFNTVARANPYILLASAIIALISGVAALTVAMDKQKKKQEELNKAHEEYMEKIDSLADAVGEAAYKFDDLQRKYQKCRTEGEKQQFLKDYKSKLDDLGIGVDDVNDLEEVFVNKTADFRRACLLRAQALSLDSSIVDEYKKAEKAIMEAQNALANIKPGQRVNEKDLGFDFLKKYNAGRWIQRWMDDYIIAGEDAFETVRNGILAEFEKTKNFYISEQDKLYDEIDSMNLPQLTSPTSNNTTSNSQKEQNKNIVNQVNLLENEKKALTDLLPFVENQSEKWKEISSRINEIDKQLKDLNEQEQAFIDRLNSQPLEPLQKLNPITSQAQTTTKLKPQITVEDMKKAYQDAASLAGDLSEYVKIGAISQDKAKAMVESINQKLKDMGITAAVSLDIEEVNTSGIDNFINKLDTARGKADTVVSSLSSAYDAISGLGDKLDSESGGLEKFFAIWDAGMSVIESATTMMKVLTPVIQALTVATEASAAAKGKETIASAANSVAKEKESGSSFKDALAKMMEAIASGSEQASKVPVIGAALAVAAAIAVTAALVGAFSKAKSQKFSQGGIFNGQYSVGDKNVALLNDGEMVLTTRQQQRLFKMLNQTGVMDNTTTNYPDLGDVRFVIQGESLVGTFDNYNRKMNKIKRQ